MNRDLRRSKSVLLVTLVSSVGLTLAAWELAPWRPSSWLAGHLEREWESASATSVDRYALQLASLEEEGWQSLARGLHSGRGEVRQAAQQALLGLIQSWRSLPLIESAPKAATLARVLADGLVPTDSDAVGRSARLAEQLLDWPPSEAGGWDRVYHCERLLRAARQHGWPNSDGLDLAPEPPAMTGFVAEPGGEFEAAPGSASAATLDAEL